MVSEKKREQIFKLLRQGRSRQEVANLCQVSYKTVERYEGLLAPETLSEMQRETLLRNPSISRVYEHLKAQYDLKTAGAGEGMKSGSI